MQKPLRLLHLMFGPQADTARANANERLLRWAAWFEDWLETRQGSANIKVTRAYTAWEELLSLNHRAPWEIQASDVQGYIDWIRETAGRKEEAIHAALSQLSMFYEYARKRAAGIEEVHNPVSVIRRPYRQRYEKRRYLDGEQVQALLEAVRRDESALGKRDYAILLMRLTTPLLEVEIRELKWGAVQLEGDGGTGWVERRGRLEGKRAVLGAEVVQAIKAYLQAAGRQDTIQAGEAVFTAPSLHSICSEASGMNGWHTETGVSSWGLWARLKKYADQAGLASEEVDWTCLRNTVVFLQAETGHSVKAIQEFFSYSSPATVAGLIKGLLTEGNQVAWKVRPRGLEGSGGGQAPGTGGMRGSDFYALALPAEDVARLEQNAPSGVNSEVSALRVVMLKALQRALETSSPTETLRLLDTFSSATTRLAQALKVQHDLDEMEGGGDELFTEAAREILSERGWE